VAAPRFRLQPALDRAEALEREARGGVARCRAAHAAALEVMTGLDRLIAEIVARAGRCARPGASVAAGAFAEYDACVHGLRRERGRRQRTVVQLAERLGEARASYAFAARQRAGLERLRERGLAQARRLADLAEAAEFDEANAGRVHEAETPAIRNERRVIVLHRSNAAPIVVNADLVETVERASEGETVVTLTTGNVLVVSESPEAVRDAAIAYRRSVGLQSA